MNLDMQSGHLMPGFVSRKLGSGCPWVGGELDRGEGVDFNVRQFMVEEHC